MRPYVKVLRDLWVARGRTAFMVLALAAGLTSMGMVLVGRSVLRREMTRSYMESVPASATFDVGQLPEPFHGRMLQSPTAWVPTQPRCSIMQPISDSSTALALYS